MSRIETLLEQVLTQQISLKKEITDLKNALFEERAVRHSVGAMVGHKKQGIKGGKKAEKNKELLDRANGII